MNRRFWWGTLGIMALLAVPVSLTDMLRTDDARLAFALAGLASALAAYMAFIAPERHVRWIFVPVAVTAAIICAATVVGGWHVYAAERAYPHRPEVAFDEYRSALDDVRENPHLRLVILGTPTVLSIKGITPADEVYLLKSMALCARLSGDTDEAVGLLRTAAQRAEEQGEESEAARLLDAIGDWSESDGG